MTLSEMITAVRSQIAEPSETTDKFWTDDEITQWINNGYRQFCMITKIVKDLFVKTYEEETREKTFTVDFAQIDRVEWENEDEDIIELLPIAMEDVDFTSDAETNTPEKYYLRSYNVIGLEPVPDEDGTLNVYCSYVPEELSGNDNEPMIPEVFHDALVEFACWKARLKYKDPLYNEHKNNFRDFLALAIKHAGTTKKKTTGIRPRFN